MHRSTSPDALLRHVVVFLEGCLAHAGIVEWTVGLAREHGAHLTGVFVEQEEAPGRMEKDPRPVFEAMARDHGIRWAWRRLSRRQVVDLAHFGPFADLAVLARRPSPRPGSVCPELSELVARAYGRPTVVLPPACPAARPRRIVVGWNAAPDNALALARAMPLLERADTVEIVLIDHDDGPCWQETAARTVRELARHGVAAELRQLSSDAGQAGQALLSRAAAFGAELARDRRTRPLAAARQRHAGRTRGGRRAGVDVPAGLSQPGAAAPGLASRGGALDLLTGVAGRARQARARRLRRPPRGGRTPRAPAGSAARSPAPTGRANSMRFTKHTLHERVGCTRQSRPRLLEGVPAATDRVLRAAR